MIPKDVQAEITPQYALTNESVPRVTLPCGLSLEFLWRGETIDWPTFKEWNVPLASVGEIAGLNAITNLMWNQVAAGVFENDDSCWQEMTLAPATFVEHNGVSGTPVLYIVSELRAILTGSKCPAGLERIRQALPRGLASCALSLNRDRKTWSPYYLGAVLAFDLPSLTIYGTATGTGRFVRQSSSMDSYGHVVLTVSPYAGPGDFLIVWSVSEETIPLEFREAIRQGIQSSALSVQPDIGPLKGVRVTVVGGSYHPVDSHENAFRKAAVLAFEDALSKVGMTRVPERFVDQSWQT